MSNLDKVNIDQKLDLIKEFWNPKIVGEVNESHVKLARLKGEFIWHHHENEDEMFLVIKGELLMKLRDREIIVKEGEFIVIPKGVEHLPVAKQEVCILLFEPKSTVNTGNVRNEKTVQNKWI
jgi:mannose-6-phosphate isomerase-like protein (cupin superfamily)